MSWWQLTSLIICFGFQSCDVFDLVILFLEVDWVTICQFLGRNWWQLDTLIICVGFQSNDALDLEMLFLEVDWVIFLMFSSAIPLIPHVITIYQGRA